MSAPSKGADVIVVRHADAGSRERYVGDDRRRPLSDKGRRQAFAIAERLAPLRPLHLVSSPATRCVGTLEPLAALLGVAVEVRDELAEGRNPRLAYAYLLAAAADLDGVRLVACTHGDILTGLVDLLEIDGTQFTNAVNLQKAATVELVGKGPVFSAATFTPPPRVPRSERVRE